MSYPFLYFDADQIQEG